MDIRLTPREAELFRLLLEVVNDHTPDTVLRVAGGWVRDKLMGRESNDIDISPDNLSGEAFAALVKRHLDRQGVRTQEVTVVKANPAQSKHLATAMLKVHGYPVDFVQLRSEGYTETSRIPTQVRPGTPEEDASRRDLTINALFYNINEARVEDHVGGMADLENRIARTPIAPLQTFMDDPLRVLRTIRFAARFDLTLDDGLIEAAKRPEVHRALKDKVSRERVWNELAWRPELTGIKPGALSGEDPLRAAAWLGALGLVDVVLGLGETDLQRLGLNGPLHPFDMVQQTPHHTSDLWAHTLEVLRRLTALETFGEPGEIRQRATASLAALLHDMGKRYSGIHGTHPEGYRTYRGHESISAQLSEAVLNNLKAPVDLARQVSRVVSAHMRPHALVDGASDKAVRRFIRDLGDDWALTVDLALADALAKDRHRQSDIETRYRDLKKRIAGLISDMNGHTSPRRPISGHDLADAGVPKGPLMGDILRALDDALLERPAMTREDALVLVQKRLAERKPDA